MTGLCTHCQEWKDHKDLKFCVSCKYVQYYLKQYQASHWPEHKASCNVYSMTDNLRICTVAEQLRQGEESRKQEGSN